MMKLLKLGGIIAVLIFAGCKSKSETKKSDGKQVNDSIPNVVAVFPPNSSNSVKPDVKELRVTFSEKMEGGISFAMENKDTFPEVTGKHVWDATGKTVTLPVKLQADKSYVIWLNSEKFKNFKSKAGKPLSPYKWTFKTTK